MSTGRRRARRLPVSAAWPVRPSPAARPWAIIPAGLAPILLTGAYLVAGILQPASYSPVRETISAMAGQAGTDRWVMTGGIVLTGGCYLVTAAGLTGVRASARALLAVAGMAGIGIAASPEPARGATPWHLAWTVLGAVTIAVWPAFAARRASPRPLILSVYGSAAVTARLRGAARLAARRNPRRQRPGPGRTADVIDPDLLAVHHRCRPAPHPAPPAQPGHRRERRGERRGPLSAVRNGHSKAGTSSSPTRVIGGGTMDPAATRDACGAGSSVTDGLAP